MANANECFWKVVIRFWNSGKEEGGILILWERRREDAGCSTRGEKNL